MKNCISQPAIIGGRCKLILPDETCPTIKFHVEMFRLSGDVEMFKTDK